MVSGVNTKVQDLSSTSEKQQLRHTFQALPTSAVLFEWKPCLWHGTVHGWEHQAA
jgi:hypothetical protein